jgi:hypothetical protein
MRTCWFGSQLTPYPSFRGKTNEGPRALLKKHMLFKDSTASQSQMKYRSR